MRRQGLDTLRGLTFVSMFLYHGCWDLVYLFGRPWGWYASPAAYVWQQSICWTFILLSGYCFALGRHQLRRGLLAFGGGALVTAVTLIALPEEPILFGVLTFLGTAALVTAALRGALERVPAGAGLAACAALFALTRNVNQGCLGFEALRLGTLPRGLYRNLATAALGFPPARFVSSDYFSLLPWLFLFWAGFYLHRLRPELDFPLRCRPAAFLGRHALLCYLLHQPVLYVLCWLLA